MVAVEICLASDSRADLATQVEKTYQAGAQRIELCAAMEDEGLTPSESAIATARKAFKRRNGLIVMIRPRAGDFCYNAGEIALMKKQIVMAATNGANGVVFGVLCREGNGFNAVAMGELIMLAKQQGLSVGVHRAFDVIEDSKAAMNQLCAWQVDRVLTSGQKWGSAAGAIDGVETLKQLALYALGRVEIVIAGGVNVDQVLPITAELIAVHGRYSFHAYSSVLLHGRHGVLHKEEIINDEVDLDKIRALVEVVNAIELAPLPARH